MTHGGGPHYQTPLPGGEGWRVAFYNANICVEDVSIVILWIAQSMNRSLMIHKRFDSIRLYRRS